MPIPLMAIFLMGLSVIVGSVDNASMVGTFVGLGIFGFLFGVDQLVQAIKGHNVTIQLNPDRPAAPFRFPG